MSRALVALVALSAVLQAAPLMIASAPLAGDPNPHAQPLASASDLSSGSADLAGVGAGQGLGPSLPRVRDGLYEESPQTSVSILILLRGEPVSSVLLELRDQYGPQESWTAQVKELAHHAIDARQDALERQRADLLGELSGAGITAFAARDYRYLVNGLNLRNFPASAIRLLDGNPEVLLIERDQIVHVELDQSVPIINADDVWNLTDAGGRNITGAGSVIANIDTGVDYTHPDLGGTLNRTNDFANLTNGSHTKFAGGWDFVNNDNDPWDDHFHGTHVAGIIGANGTVRGVAPGSKQLGLKVLSASGYGSDSDIIAAMEFATDPDRDPLTDDAADATSMSLGGWDPNPDGLEPLAADASTKLGTVCIIAAGNSGPGRSTVGSPGISRVSITVGSTTKADLMSGFSSRGPTLYLDLKPDLVAPGSSIVSTANGGAGGTYTASGTSMATPHVSGVVALLRQAHPTWGVDDLKSALVNTAKNLGYGVFEQGGGRVDALAAENASVVAYPHKLAVGRLSQSATATNATVDFTNLGAASVTMDLSARDVFGMFPNMTGTAGTTDLNYVTVSPSSITLAPGERKTVVVSFSPSGSAAAGYYWGSVNATFLGSTVAVPFAYLVRAPVALVDDDSSDRARASAPFDNFAGLPSSSNNLSAALSRLNVSHDIITVAHYDDNGPEVLELLNYALVIWNYGYEYGYSDSFHTHHSLSTRDRAALSSYLDAGGQLWMLGESLAWDLYGAVNGTVPAEDFMGAYLGVSRVDHELNTPDPVNGTAATFMAGASYATSPDWTLWGNSGDFATNLTPSARGFTIMGGSAFDIYGKSYPTASVAVAVNNSTYRSVFWGFEFSWLTTSANFDNAVNRTLGFFDMGRVLTLPVNDLAVEVLVDPLLSDWLPLFSSDWGRPFDAQMRLLEPFNVTVVLRNLGSAAQQNVSVNVTLRDNASRVLQTVRLDFTDVPALSRVSNSSALTANRHGYFTVNADTDRSDANAANNADAKAVLIPNWQNDVGSSAGWTMAGTWRTTNAWSYTASRSFRAGAAQNANDTLQSPLIDLSRVNASSIAGGARLYFEMSGVVGGGDTLFFETRTASNATWVTQRTLTSLNIPNSWNYFLQGVSLSNIANSTGYFRARIQTGAASTSYVHLDHFEIWTNHEYAAAVGPSITVVNATREEGQPLSFLGSHGNPNNSTNFTYLWEFGDGLTATTQNATHTYLNNGTYLVNFTVNDSIAPPETAAMSLAVANAPPTVSSATAVPSTSVEGAAVAFNATCADPGVLDVLTYSWNFGDASANESGRPLNHTYADEGNYTVTLTCSDGDGGSAVSSFFHSVTNAAPSVDSAGSSPNPSDEGQTVNFTGSCTDVGTLDNITYSWNFGDGTVNATGSTVAHTFADEGNFSVRLTCSDGDGGANSTAITQTVVNVAPSMNSPIISPSPSDEGSLVSFSIGCFDPGTLDVVSITWNFGDASPGATGASTSHTYVDNGAYQVTITCTDGDGGITLAAEIQNVNNVAPSASIFGPNATVEGTPLAFGAQASDPGALDILTYLWSFGDGGTATTRNVTHTWRDNGVFAVSLTVADNAGASTAAQINVTVQNVAPTANFTFAGNATEGSALTLTATVNDPGADDTFTYLWEFGDASVGTAGAPIHTFADDGSYLVNLTVTDDDGASVRVSRLVAISNLNPAASLSQGEPSGIEGTNTSFTLNATDAGVNDALTYSVTFGDGTPALTGPLTGSTVLRHAFPNEGNYTVTAVVQDGDGGSTTVALVFGVVNAPPTLFAEASAFVVDEGSTVNFTARASDLGALDGATVTWDLGPGTTPVGGLAASRTFPQDGIFDVTVTAVDDAGASATVTLSIVVNNVAPVLTVTLPDPLTLFEGAAANFSATATDAGPLDTISIAWVWGDGLNSLGGAPSHTYADEGNYTLVVTATDDAGARATSSYVLHIQNVGPSIGQIVVPSLLEEGAALNFSAVITSVPGESLTFLWSFGDGGTATAVSASHAFRDSGTFTVRLTASDGEGGVDTAVRTVEVDNVAPSLSCQVCPDSAVEGQRISIRSHAVDPGRNDTVTYRLLFPNGTSLTSTDGSFDFSLDEAGDASLSLRADDGDGGSSSVTVRINVKPDFDGDGLEDSVDPDDDNDGTPDTSDPAPLDPAVGRPTVSTPTGGYLGWLLLLAVLGAAVVLVVLRVRRRGDGAA